MAEGVPVRELVAQLGLDVDEASFGFGDSLIRGIAGGLLSIGTIAAGAGLAIAGLAKQTADAADQIDELSQQTGVNAESLQRLGHAASFSGLGLEDLAQVMNFMAKKGVRDVEGEFLRLSDQMAALPEEGGARAAFAMEHFGRSGARLVPMLNRGSEALRAQMGELDRFGVLMGKDAIQAGVDFSDSLNWLRLAFVGLRNTIGMWAIPTMTKMIKAFTEFVVSVRPTGERVDWLIDKLKILGWIMGSVLAGIIVANIGHIAMATAMWIGMGTASMGAGLAAAKAWLIAAAPMVPFILLLAFIILLIDDIWVTMEGGESILGKWSAWLDKWLAEDDPGEHWIVTMLKSVLWLLTDITERFPAAIREWKDMLGGFFSGGWRNVNMTADGNVDFTNAFGGGASPDATVQTSAPAAQGPRVIAPGFKMDLQIVAPHGASGVEIGEGIRPVLDQWYEEKMIEAGATLAPVAGG